MSSVVESETMPMKCVIEHTDRGTKTTFPTSIELTANDSIDYSSLNETGAEIVPGRVILNHVDVRVTEGRLKEILETIGPVTMLKRVPFNKYAFADYLDHKDVQRACEKLNGLSLWGSPIKVAPARINMDTRQTNIYLQGLPSGWTVENLMDYFTSFGKVVNVKILSDVNTGVSRSVGFVRFSSRETAEFVLATMNGMDVGEDGQKWQMSWTHGWKGGRVSSVKEPKSEPLMSSTRLDRKDEKNHVASLYDRMVASANFQQPAVMFHRPVVANRQPEAVNRQPEAANRQPEAANRQPEVTDRIYPLLVSNISRDMTVAALALMFQEYGQVLAVEISVIGTESGGGVGTVKMAKGDEAFDACASLNGGVDPSGHVIHVQIVPEEDFPAFGLFGPPKNYTGFFMREGHMFLQTGEEESDPHAPRAAHRYRLIQGTNLCWHVSTRNWSFWIPPMTSFKYEFEQIGDHYSKVFNLARVMMDGNYVGRIILKEPTLQYGEEVSVDEYGFRKYVRASSPPPIALPTAPLDSVSPSLNVSMSTASRSTGSMNTGDRWGVARKSSLDCLASGSKRLNFSDDSKSNIDLTSPEISRIDSPGMSSHGSLSMPNLLDPRHTRSSRKVNDSPANSMHFEPVASSSKSADDSWNSSVALDQFGNPVPRSKQRSARLPDYTEDESSSDEDPSSPGYMPPVNIKSTGSTKKKNGGMEVAQEMSTKKTYKGTGFITASGRHKAAESSSELSSDLQEMAIVKRATGKRSSAPLSRSVSRGRTRRAAVKQESSGEDEIPAITSTDPTGQEEEVFGDVATQAPGSARDGKRARESIGSYGRPKKTTQRK